MNTRAYLILFLFLLWSLGSGYFYVCKIKQKCVVNSESVTSTAPFKFNYNSELPEITAGFDVYKENILAKLGATNKLSVVGNYGANETNSTTFDNLGVARAAAIRNLFPNIDDSRFVFSAKQIDLDPTINAIDGASVSVLLHNDFVDQTTFGAVIHFPSNAKMGVISPEIDEYLNMLVADYKNNDIDIVGHTDNAGADADNFGLAMARAASIKDELIAKGMPVEKLNAISKGETEPIADNSTEQGRSQNRRVEIIINE